MNKVLDSLEKYILYIVVLLVPLFVLPSFTDLYTLPKLVVLIVGITLVLIIKCVRLLVLKKIEFSSSSFDIPLLVITIGYTLSSIFTTANKMEAFFMPGNASILIGSLALYFLLNNLNLSEKNTLKVFLFASALVASLVSILSASGLFSKIYFITSYFQGGKVNLMGGSLPQIIFLIGVLPLIVELIINSRDFAKKVFLATGSVVVLLALILSIVNVLPGKPEAIELPSFQTSFSVLLDTVKESPLLGSGAGNYLSAFNRFRPISYNSTPLWQMRFSTANNFYFTVITETGLIGLVGIVLLFISVLGIVKKLRVSSVQVFKEGHIISLVSLLLLLVFFPANITVVVLLFVVISLSANTRKNEFTVPSTLAALPYLVSAPVIGAIAALYFFGFQALAAENMFLNSLVSLNKGDAKATYDQMRQAINMSPYVDRYHAAYAQTNIAIAQSLAQKKDLSDSDRQTVATLIQQAIREGKNVVILNPTRSGSWELLARIYQSIIPFAQGSDKFAIQTYSQAISLDPINPNLRISAGGVLYSLGLYDTAIDTFKLAVAAKPDFPNSHYNLSAAYREKKEYDNAIAEMEAVLSLVKKDSNDYKTAQAELEALKKKKPAASLKTNTQAPAENLTQPEKKTQVITPPLELPQEATPPAATN